MPKECSTSAAKGMFKKVRPARPQPFTVDARSVLSVREHGKKARTPLAAFFNIPKIGNYTRPGQALQRHEISVYSKMMNPSDLLEQIQQRSPHLPASLLQDFLAQMDPDYFDQFPLETILQHLELTHQLTFAFPLCHGYPFPLLSAISDSFGGV